MFTNERQVVCFKSLNNELISLSFSNEWFSIVDIVYISLIMAYLWGFISVIRCMNLAYGLQSGLHRNIYLICNVSLNKNQGFFFFWNFKYHLHFIFPG